MAEVNFVSTKSIRVNKLLAHDNESRSMFPTTLGYFFNRAFVAETAPALVITAPRLLAPKIYLWTIESRSDSSNGRPVLILYLGIAFFGDKSFDFAAFKSALTLLRNVPAVLSFRAGKRCPNFLTVAAGLFIETYLPIS